MRPLRLTLLTVLACALAGCSRSQKSGTTISAKDIALAMPEFTLVVPPGAAYVFLERNSHPPVTMAWLKLTVPRASLTNFLTLSGLNGDFHSAPAGAFGRRAMPLPVGLNAGSAVASLADMRHASQSDPGKGNAPLLLGVILPSAKSAPTDQAFLLIL